MIKITSENTANEAMERSLSLGQNENSFPLMNDSIGGFPSIIKIPWILLLKIVQTFLIILWIRYVVQNRRLCQNTLRF